MKLEGLIVVPSNLAWTDVNDRPENRGRQLRIWLEK
jgi:hypothetical protein